MLNQINIVFIFSALFFVFTKTEAQSVIQIEKRAFEAYYTKQYELAKVDFQQLLARDPESPTYNFHYAVCLYNTESKNNAKKYFDFVVNHSTAFCGAHYYLGKIHHLAYRFEDAKAAYNSYLACDPQDALDATKEINYCKNGQQLLDNPKALKTLVSLFATDNTFYQKYDLDTIGGKIYSDLSLQSKLDKKKGYVPVCYYKRGELFKFYTSYGEAGTSTKIFYIQRISQDVWSKPLQVNLSSETVDACYPYFDPVSKILYFSSNGFNSMGGYDLFKASFDPESNSVGEVENLDFPFSSAADDYFFIPLDASATVAWFGTNRNATLGKCEALNVSYTKDSEGFIAMSGQFVDYVDPKNKRIQLKVKDLTDNTEYGPFTSDELGKYKLMLPGTGTYVFTAYINGTEKVFEDQKLIPSQKDNIAFKQTIKYSLDNESELAVFTYDFKDPISEEMKSFKSTAISQLAMVPRLASGSQEISTDKSQELSANDYLQNLALNGNTIQERSESLVDKLLEISNTGLDLKDQVDDYQMKKTASIQRLDAMNKQVAAYQDLIKTVPPQSAVVYAEALNALIDSVKKETINLSLVSQQLNATQEKLKEWNELNAEPSVLALSNEIKLALIQENEDSLENVILNFKEPIDNYLQFPGSFVYSKEIPSGNEAIIALKEDLMKLTAQLKQNTADINALAVQKEGASKKEQGQIDEKIAALTKSNTALESSIQTEEQSLNELTVKAAFATSGVSPSDSSLATLVEKIEELSAQQDVLILTIAKAKNNTTLANESNPAQLTALELEQTRAQKQVVLNQLKFASNAEKEGLSNKIQYLDSKIDSLESRLPSQQLAATQPESENTTQRTTNTPTTNTEATANNTSPVNNAEANNATQRTTETPTTNIEATANNTSPENNAEANNATQRTTETPTTNTEAASNSTSPENNAQANNATQRTTETPTTNTEAASNSTTPQNNAEANNATQRTTETPTTNTEGTANSTSPENNAEANNATQRTTETPTANTEVASNSTSPENNAEANNAKQQITETPATNIEAASNSTSPENNSEANNATQRTTETLATNTEGTANNTSPANNAEANNATQRTTEIPTTNTEATANNISPENNAEANNTTQRTTETPTTNTEATANSTSPENNAEANNATQPTTVTPTTNTEATANSTSPENNLSAQAENSADQPAMLRKASDNIDIVQEQIAERKNASAPEQQALGQLSEQLSTVAALLLVKQSYGDSVYSELISQQDINQLSDGISATQKEIQSVASNSVALDTANLNRVLRPQVIKQDLREPWKAETGIALTEKEEKMLASDPGYDQYLELRKQMVTTRATIDQLEQELLELKVTLYRSKDAAEKQRLIVQLAELASRKLTLEKQYADQALNMNSMDHLAAYHRMVDKGIVPVQLTAQPEGPTLEQMTFGLTDKLKQGNTYPVLTSMPQGLIFRVQVGVFRNAVPDYFFREFTPVTGEALTNGLTAYLTGYFVNSNTALTARGQVRGVGYTDAFIVAYCDGKRIPYALALTYEKQGLCNLRSEQEVQAEVFNLVKSQGIDNTAKASKPSEVYYTVQVAALKNLDNGKLANVPELLYNRSQQGLYKYSSGKFNQLNTAKNRRTELKALGYTDAYIVAYRDGIPVSFKEAEIALKYQDEPKQESVASLVAPKNVDLSGVNLPKMEKKQLVFKKNAIPSGVEEMKSYNRFESFVSSPQSLTSAPCELEDISPLLAIYYADFDLIPALAPSRCLSVVNQSNQLGLIHDFALRNQIPFRVMEGIDKRSQVDFFPTNEQDERLIFMLGENLMLNVISSIE